MDWLSGSRQGEIKKLVSLLGDPSKREEAARELIRRDAACVPLLLDALQTQDASLLAVYQHILAAIPSSVPMLINSLNTGHPILRGRIVEVLGLSRNSAAVPALTDALKSEFFTVRGRAVTALAKIGDPSVLSSLMPFLKDPEAEVRVAACIAVASFRDPSTFEEIANVLLDDSRLEVRQAAARALGETRHAAAVPYLMEALRDPFWWYEREQAASDLLRALEQMGTAAVPPLIEALADGERTIRKFAATLLGNLRDPIALQELGTTIYDLHHEVSQAAAESLAKYGPSAVDLLSQTARHPEAGIRLNAALALGKISDARVVPILLEMIRDPDRSVKKQVMLSLGVLRDHRAVPALQEITSNRADRELYSLAKELLARFER
jgi:HEAT repeat protein